MRVRLDQITPDHLIVMVPGCRPQTHPVRSRTHLDDGRVQIVFGTAGIQTITAPADHKVTTTREETDQ